MWVSKITLVGELRRDLAGQYGPRFGALVREERALTELVSRWMVKRRVVDDVDDLVAELRGRR